MRNLEISEGYRVGLKCFDNILSPARLPVPPLSHEGGIRKILLWIINKIKPSCLIINLLQVEGLTAILPLEANFDWIVIVFSSSHERKRTGEPRVRYQRFSRGGEALNDFLGFPLVSILCIIRLYFDQIHGIGSGLGVKTGDYLLKIDPRWLPT